MPPRPRPPARHVPPRPPPSSPPGTALYRLRHPAHPSRPAPTAGHLFFVPDARLLDVIALFRHATHPGAPLIADRFEVARPLLLAVLDAAAGYEHLATALSPQLAARQRASGMRHTPGTVPVNLSNEDYIPYVRAAGLDGWLDLDVSNGFMTELMVCSLDHLTHTGSISQP